MASAYTLYYEGKGFSLVLIGAFLGRISACRRLLGGSADALLNNLPATHEWEGWLELVVTGLVLVTVFRCRRLEEAEAQVLLAIEGPC